MQQCEWEVWNAQFERDCSAATASFLPGPWNANKNLVKDLREAIRQASGLSALKGYQPKGREERLKMAVWPIVIRLDLGRYEGEVVGEPNQKTMPSVQLQVPANPPHQLPSVQIHTSVASPYQMMASVYGSTTASPDYFGYYVPCQVPSIGVASYLDGLRVSTSEFWKTMTNFEDPGSDLYPGTPAFQTPVLVPSQVLFEKAKKRGPLVIVDPSTGLVKSGPFVSKATSTSASSSTDPVGPAGPPAIAPKRKFQAPSSLPKLPKAEQPVVFRDSSNRQVCILAGTRNIVIPTQSPAPSSPSSSTSSTSTTSSASGPSSATSPGNTPPPPDESNPCRPGCICATIRKLHPYIAPATRPTVWGTHIPPSANENLARVNEYNRLTQARCLEVKRMQEIDRKRRLEYDY